ncbi:phage tail protein [Frischella sp. Ac13]|uniref:Phage tail protein n=1 Tax=Frischella japonica TaxID=2741544 RepID=A0ABR7QXD9_9GAMM|nr:phage tail protein [Frischella japonica]MBC9130726.1 phage tail protein [Frischella japonica]
MAKEDNLTRANTNTDLNEKLFGGAVVLELAHGNPNTPPQEADWVRFMAGTSKGMDLSPNSVTSDADDQGSFVETVVTSVDLTNSFEGEVRKKDAENEFGFHKMFKFIVDKISAKQQPALWVRFNQGGSVLTAFMVVTAFSSNGGTNDLYTCSAEFKIACGKTVKVELVN